MYRLLPIFLMLAVSPESDKKLEHLSSFITATKDTVLGIRNGIESFHAAMMPFMESQETGKTSASASTPKESEEESKPLA
ncbi:MAG: hypothetical protein A4E55_00734 [Pelotomaculum sp. PtaU1.Bin035]|nr:MAG: hypothetical protein A4E55_00734 [Pelotomaculum sp. PtaU1.Bin035]